MDDFDFLISKYSDDLIKMKEKWSRWGIVTEEKKETSDEYPAEEPKEMPEKEAEGTSEAISVVAMTQDTPAEDAETPPAKEEKEAETEDVPAAEEAPSADENRISDYPKANSENYATFTARVFSGEETYPIEGAKVMIYKGGNLHTFLITGENGETATVKIESAPAENALIPNSENQEIDYSADVYADGFTPKKGLLVSAVGNSSILLTVQLTPLSERID